MTTLPSWLRAPKEEAWHALFANRTAHRSLFRVTNNAPEMIAPPLNGDEGIWSDDRRFTRLLTELAEDLTERFPANIDSEGFGGQNAVISDFRSLRNRAGWYMDPATVPMLSNETVCDSLDLATGFLSERDRAIFKALHHFMFRTIVPAPLSIRKTASSGAPYFTSAVDEKKKALMVFNQYSPVILNRFLGGDLKGLYTDYGLFFATYMGVRVQPDSVKVTNGRAVPKPREVNDELYARSGGKEGRRFVADKTVRDADGNVIEGVFAMRRRAVYAYPAMYNYWLTQFFSPMRAFYLNQAEFTYKHRDADSIVEKLAPFTSVRGYDVKQFDQSIRPWLMDAFVDGFSGFLKEEVIQFLRAVLRQPIYMPHPGVGAKYEFNPCFGDPWDLSSFNLAVGLPSGIGPNPDMGKFFMTFAYLCLLDRHFSDVLEIGVSTILRGAHDRYALLDMGDDAVLAVNDESFWATADRVAGATFYVRLEAEEGISFLGNVIYKDRDGRLAAAPNVVTMIRNRLCPEHGVQHWSRRDFAGTGWFDGKRHYSSAPLFGEVWNAWDDAWRAHFGEGIDTRFMASYREERHRGVPSLSEADRAVLENPDKLYYRYSIEDVHPWVLDKIVGNVPFDDYFPQIEQYFV